jgi:hypothetical protein
MQLMQPTRSHTIHRSAECMQELTDPIMLPIIISIVNLAAVAVSLNLAYRQVKKTHEWNRRKASHDLLIQLGTGDVRAMRHVIEVDFVGRIYDDRETFEDVMSGVENQSRKLMLEDTLKGLLNYFESVAIGLKNHVLDDDICYDFTADVMAAYWRWGKPYIMEIQRTSPRAWIETEKINERWSGRTREILQKQKEHGRIAGRNPT